MWPMVPLVHMIYRLWQLGRGSALAAALHGPVYVLYLQVHVIHSLASHSLFIDVAELSTVKVKARSYAWLGMALYKAANLQSTQKDLLGAGLLGDGMGPQFWCCDGMDALAV